jgi:hypothetical protein
MKKTQKSGKFLSENILNTRITIKVFSAYVEFCFPNVMTNIFSSEKCYLLGRDAV